MFSVHTKLENLKTVLSFWESIEYFPSCTLSPLEYKNSTNGFGFVFEENLWSEITWLSWRHRFKKAPFSKRFCPHKRRRFTSSSGLKSVSVRSMLITFCFMYTKPPVHREFATAALNGTDCHFFFFLFTLNSGFLNGNPKKNAVNELFNVNYMYWLNYP